MPPQLSRLLIIFGALAVLFVVLKWVASPDSFYQYGHYRGAALMEALERTPNYAPINECKSCHDDESALHKSGPHAGVSCQICHGPGQVHADDPEISNITRPDARALCLRCHEERQARPKWYPQINESEHAGGESCNSCHVVHNPLEFADGESHE